MGSGSTGKAAKLEGFGFIGIEKDESYCKIAHSRIHPPAKKSSEKKVNKECQHTQPSQ
jgi:DNA modification methylase